jgi:hypothetical protein
MSQSAFISAELAVRAAFFARLHRKWSVEEWLTHIIQERVELEEAAFAGVKHELVKKGGKTWITQLRHWAAKFIQKNEVINDNQHVPHHGISHLPQRA